MQIKDGFLVVRITFIKVRKSRMKWINKMNQKILVIEMKI